MLGLKPPMSPDRSRGLGRDGSILVLDDGVRAVSAAGGFRVPLALVILVLDGFRVAGDFLLLDDDLYLQLAETFRALADSSRVKIVYSLLRQELCTCDLAAITGQSESAVSQHLRVLRQLRLVRNRRATHQYAASNASSGSSHAGSG